jgi:hypothetical protein
MEIATYNTMTDNEGYFHVETILGTYDVVVKNSHTLANKVMSITIPAAGTSDIDFGELFEGDANNDKTVPGMGYAAFTSRFRKNLRIAGGEPFFGFFQRACNYGDIKCHTGFFFGRRPLF